MVEAIVNLMNEILMLDPAAAHALVANRVPCNEALRDHPTINVDVRNDALQFPTVGLLGVLNGLTQPNAHVVAVFDGDAHCLLRFEAKVLGA